MKSAPLSRPVIGITCGEIHNKDEAWSPMIYGQSRTYADAILQAGGIPLFLPVTDDKRVVSQLCDTLDGLFMAGGNDLHPNLYGQEVRDVTSDYSVTRDAAETAILAEMLGCKKPILAICRGMQLLNVYYGGQLYQDIATDVPGALDHGASTKLKTLVDMSHTLRVAPDSRLAQLIGSSPIGANAHHHQAISVLGRGIRAVAWTEDGIIEAVEMPDYPFAIGIQAHPESLTEVEPRWRRVFEAFIANCPARD